MQIIQKTLQIDPNGIPETETLSVNLFTILFFYVISISLLDQFNLLHINDSIPQIANYAMFLTEQQEPERGISELQKLSGIIKEYHSDDCLDYAKVQETLGTIYLMTANLSQAKTHFKKAVKIYEKIWADEPEMIKAKYREIQELYPQVGSFLGQQISSSLTKQA